MRLTPNYNGNGELRLFWSDDEGGEVLFHKDKKRGLIIREFREDDALPYFNNMIKKKLNPEEKRNWVESFQAIVRENKGLDEKCSLAITSLTGKILGEIAIDPIEKNGWIYEAEITISLRDEFMIAQKGEKVIEAVWAMNEQFKWFDTLYLKDNSGNRIELRTA